MDGLLEDLLNASQIPARQRARKPDGVVDRLCSAAYEHGLEGPALTKLLDLVTRPNELDQSTNVKLIKHLYPASRVAEDAVVKVIGALGHGQNKPSMTAQTLLLKWLVMVHDVMEQPRAMSKLYAVLFNLLDTIALRTLLCHLLALITRRAHVRPYRVQTLMEMIRQVGSEPGLVGLLRVYKDYYPDVMVGSATQGRAAPFTQPDVSWQQRLAAIQDIHAARSQEQIRARSGGFVAKRTGYKAHNGPIPLLQTLHAGPTATTLEEISSADDLVRKLDKIELPNQLAAVLVDPLLQKYVGVLPTDAIIQRIDGWLAAYFDDQMLFPESDTKLQAMLDAIVEYTRFSKALLPSCWSFLVDYLPTWDGIVCRGNILELLSYMPKISSEELKNNILIPLERALLDGSTQARLDMLGFHTMLISRWSANVLSDEEAVDAAIGSINDLVPRVHTLALSTLEDSGSIAVSSSILTFYQTTLLLYNEPLHEKGLRISIPPDALIYRLQYTQSISILSRLCSQLAQYKRAFEHAQTHAPEIYQQAYTKRFNGFLMDFCNCIWRSRAFSTVETNARACGLTKVVVDTLTRYLVMEGATMPLSSLFTFSFAPLTCALAIGYVRQLEDAAAEDEIELRHSGPITQSSLVDLHQRGGIDLSFANYKLGVLAYLEARGAVGVSELIYSTIKNLMAKKQRSV